MDGLPDNPRLFVAVELPAPVLEELRRLQELLRRGELRNLRWVGPEGIHLTLKFLGETPRARVPAIEAAVKHAAEGIPAHAVSLGKLGRFGRWRRLSVVWVGISGDVVQLSTLQTKLQRALKEIGFPAEARKFQPHLTLARVPLEIAHEVAPAVETAVHTSVRSIPIPVNEVSLMRSTLSRGGAAYDRVASFPLARREVPN